MLKGSDNDELLLETTRDGTLSCCTDDSSTGSVAGISNRKLQVLKQEYLDVINDYVSNHEKEDEGDEEEVEQDEDEDQEGHEDEEEYKEESEESDSEILDDN